MAAISQQLNELYPSLQPPVLAEQWWELKHNIQMQNVDKAFCEEITLRLHKKKDSRKCEIWVGNQGLPNDVFIKELTALHVGAPFSPF